MGCPGAVGADQQLLAVRGGDLRDRVMTAMWSAAVFDPARPVRNMAARNSSVLSHHTPSGWNPKVFLNVGEACSFSLWAITIVATTSVSVLPLRVGDSSEGRN